jgi:hypothetical protein
MWTHGYLFGSSAEAGHSGQKPRGALCRNWSDQFNIDYLLTGKHFLLN